MKKRFLVLLAVFTLVLTANSLAASKEANAKPSLTFNGNTAVCFASCGPVQIYAQNCLQTPAE